MPLVFCVTSLLMLGFTLFIYVQVLTAGSSSERKSSTDALVLVIVPFYLFIGGAILLGGGLIWTAISKSFKDKNI
jgi:hypothetical protein